MAVIDQTIPQRAADVEKTKLLAQMLMRNSQQGQDPYAQTGGPYSRVIPVHPLAAALQGLQAGFGAYYANQAQDQQAELEQQKLNATREAFAGGNMDVEKLAGSGAVDAGTLAKLLMGKSGQEGPVYDYLNTNQGVLRADKRSKFAEVVTGADGQPYRIAGADPNLQGQIQNAKTANTGYKLADESGREGLFSGQQANPAAFGQGQQAPQAPQQAQFQFNDVDNLRAFLQSDEGKALLAGKNPSDAATGQGGAEQFAGRADNFAKGQGQSNQVWGKTGGYGGGMVKGPSIEEKTAAQEGVKTEFDIMKMREADRLKAEGEQRKLENVSKKPLPPQALRMQQDELDALGTASSINADLNAVLGQMEGGKLQLGLLKNLESEARYRTGNSDENARNYATFKATLEKLRNDSLRLNKGVQTEGDAVRAWSENFPSLSDQEGVKDRLREIQAINERAAKIRQMNIDNIRANYGYEPMDVTGYMNQPATVKDSTTLTPEEQRELEELRARFGRK